jgi:hypothetical protein
MRRTDLLCTKNVEPILRYKTTPRYESVFQVLGAIGLFLGVKQELISLKQFASVAFFVGAS